MPGIGADNVLRSTNSNAAAMSYNEPRLTASPRTLEMAWSRWVNGLKMQDANIIVVSRAESCCRRSGLSVSPTERSVSLIESIIAVSVDYTRAVSQRVCMCLHGKRCVCEATGMRAC